MKYGICVLANAMPLFEVMLSTYPQELRDDKFDLVVVNETRIDDKTERIKALLTKYNIKNYKVITDKDINAKVKEYIVDVPLVDDCFFTMNILPLWYLMKFDPYDKLLLLDDDIILQDGISTIFESNKSMFQPYFLNVGSNKPYDQIDDTCKALHIATMTYTGLPTTKEFHDEVFIKNYLNGGNRFIVKNDYKEEIYEKALHGFFTSQIVTDFWNSGKSPYSGNLDERFESAVFYAMGITNSGLKKVVKYLWCKPERLSDKAIMNCKNALIVHYSMGSHKLEFVKRLMDLGYIPFIEDVYNVQKSENKTGRRTNNFTLNCD